MNIFIAILLGILQGMTEFIPVSSSGHLQLVQEIIHRFDPTYDVPRFFDIMLHVGSLCAVFVVFRKDILSILRQPLKKLPIMIVIAMVPTAIIAVLLDKYAGSLIDGAYLGYGFMITGILLYAMEYLPKRKGKKSIESMSLVDALSIGVAQGIGVLPGISRSGITIAGGVFRGLSREFLAKFSFLLSIPAILGALCFDVFGLIKDKEPIGVGVLPLIFGMLAAGISAFFAIKYMLQLITRRSFKPFAIYVFFLGFLVSLDMFAFHIVFK